MTDMGPNEQLLPDITPSLVDEVHKIAQGAMRRERPDHTLDAHAVANEAWMVLARQRNLDPSRRSHYLGAASLTIRRFLWDYARHKQTEEAGGKFERVSLHSWTPDLAKGSKGAVDLIVLEEALQELERLNPRAGQVVTMRFFGGMTNQEIADSLGVSLRTVNGDWKFSKTWLTKRMDPPDP